MSLSSRIKSESIFLKKSTRKKKQNILTSSKGHKAFKSIKWKIVLSKLVIDKKWVNTNNSKLFIDIKIENNTERISIGNTQATIIPLSHIIEPLDLNDKTVTLIQVKKSPLLFNEKKIGYNSIEIAKIFEEQQKSEISTTSTNSVNTNNCVSGGGQNNGWIFKSIPLVSNNTTIEVTIYFRISFTPIDDNKSYANCISISERNDRDNCIDDKLDELSVFKKENIPKLKTAEFGATISNNNKNYNDKRVDMNQGSGGGSSDQNSQSPNESYTGGDICNSKITNHFQKLINVKELKVQNRGGGRLSSDCEFRELNFVGSSTNNITNQQQQAIRGDSNNNADNVSITNTNKNSHNNTKDNNINLLQEKTKVTKTSKLLKKKSEISKSKTNNTTSGIANQNSINDISSTKRNITKKNLKKERKMSIEEQGSFGEMEETNKIESWVDSLMKELNQEKNRIKQQENDIIKIKELQNKRINKLSKLKYEFNMEMELVSKKEQETLIEKERFVLVKKELEDYQSIVEANLKESQEVIDQKEQSQCIDEMRRFYQETKINELKEQIYQEKKEVQSIIDNNSNILKNGGYYIDIDGGIVADESSDYDEDEISYDDFLKRNGIIENGLLENQSGDNINFNNNDKTVGGCTPDNMDNSGVIINPIATPKNFKNVIIKEKIHQQKIKNNKENACGEIQQLVPKIVQAQHQIQLPQKRAIGFNIISQNKFRHNTPDNMPSGIRQQIHYNEKQKNVNLNNSQNKNPGLGGINSTNNQNQLNMYHTFPFDNYSNPFINKNVNKCIQRNLYLKKFLETKKNMEDIRTDILYYEQIEAVLIKKLEQLKIKSMVQDNQANQNHHYIKKTSQNQQQVHQNPNNFYSKNHNNLARDSQNYTYKDCNTGSNRNVNDTGNRFIPNDFSKIAYKSNLQINDSKIAYKSNLQINDSKIAYKSNLQINDSKITYKSNLQINDSKNEYCQQEFIKPRQLSFTHYHQDNPTDTHKQHLQYLDADDFYHGNTVEYQQFLDYEKSKLDNKEENLDSQRPMQTQSTKNINNIKPGGLVINNLNRNSFNLFSETSQELKFQTEKLLQDSDELFNKPIDTSKFNYFDKKYKHTPTNNFPYSNPDTPINFQQQNSKNERSSLNQNENNVIIINHN